MHSYPAHWAPTAEELTEDFLRASANTGNNAREIYLAREAMLSILRLARAEQLLDIRRSVDKLIPASLRTRALQRGKSRRQPPPHPGQTHFVFGREN